MKYGRPMKSKTRRIPITVHVSIGLLELIDSYVDKLSANTIETAYSRSDFYNDAAILFLQNIGIQVDDVPDHTDFSSK